MSGKIEISRELAPCPLCGAEAESHGYADSDQLFVQCTDCGCSVEVGSGRFEIWNERAAAPVVERQPVGIVLPDYVDPEKASSRHGAEIWNACLDKIKELNQ